MKMSHFGVGHLLNISLGSVVGLVLVAGLIGSLSLKQMAQEYDRVALTDLPSVGALTQLARQSYAMVNITPALVSAGSQASRRDAVLELQDRESWFDRTMTDLERTGLPLQDLKQLGQLKGEVLRNQNDLDRLVERKIAAGDAYEEAIRTTLGLQREILRLTTALAEQVGSGTASPEEVAAVRRWFLSRLTAITEVLASTGDRTPGRVHQRRQEVARLLGDPGSGLAGAPPRARTLLQPVEDRLLDVLTSPRNPLALRADSLTLRDTVTGLTLANEETSVAFVAKVTQAIQLIDQDVRAASEINRVKVYQSYVLFLTTAGISIFLGLAVSFYVHRFVVVRLDRLRQCMRARSLGTKVPIPTTGHDEIADMARSVEVFVEVIEQREWALSNATRRAEEASVAKTHFFAAASHDLRQPLNALSLHLGILRMQPLDARSRHVVMQMQCSLTVMVDLFNAIMDIAKFEANQIRPEIEDVDAEEILTHIDNDFRLMAEAKGLGLRIVHTKAVLRTDRLLLERILRNLVLNAIRYTTSGRVLVGLRRRGPMSRIDVIDTGAGIPADAIKRIFDDFYQLDNPSRSRNEGHGLGLSIVRRAARLLGHPVDVDSRPGKGTRFSILVPNSGAPTVAESAEPGPLARGDALRVLLVEDDPLVGSAMETLLEDLGATVTTAASGPDAVEAAEHLGQHPPDVVIADYRLPGPMNGLQVIATLRGSWRQPFIAFLVTGDPDPTIAATASQLDVHFLPKPIRAEDMRRSLAAITARDRHLPTA